VKLRGRWNIHTQTKKISGQGMENDKSRTRDPRSAAP
jgi:hypothetical protein